MISHYEIVDGHTGKVVGTAKSRASASRMVDRRDSAYGACRYTARPIWTEAA